MLNREALESALQLTEVLDSQGFRLLAIPGTPLDELTKATRSDANFNTFSNGEFQPNITDICYIANCKDEMLQCSPHDVAMDHVTDVAIKAVREHMVFAKNVVAPAVQQLVEQTMSAMNDMTPSSMTGMEVVVWETPKPMENTALATAVRKYEEVPYDTPVLGMKLPNMAVSDIIELMGSGSGSLDKDVAFWASTKGESFFIRLWENVFQIKQADLKDNIPVSFRDFIENRVDGVDNALAIFLISRKLFDNAPKDVAMSSASFNSLIVDYRNQSASRLCRALNDMDKIEKSKVLIRSIDKKRVVTVNSTVYRAWIDAGGDNEVLFGNALETMPSTLADDISAKAPMLKVNWQRHATLISITEDNKKFSRTKEILARNFDLQMRTTENENITLGNREMISKTFNSLLQEVRVDEIDDLWKLCLKLVCRSRFSRTEAERILSGIERIKKQHPEIDVREAAAASVIEYVAYWVSTQFRVCKI
jgi:hypothetical protein